MVVSALLFVATIGSVFAQTPSPQAPPEPARSEFRPDVRQSQSPPAAKEDVGPEMRGDILMARKMFREAIDAYKEAPETAVILNKIGIAYHQMLQLDAAKKYYDRAIKLDGQDSEAINNLGTISYAKKNYRRAISQYKKALKINPDAASIYSNLGTAYF